MSGPEWSSTAIVVYWDEWGGFYDHVPPPQVDNVSFGFRVPLIVISPWTKRGPGSDGGSISSMFYSQSSILKLVEDNWALPSLDPRDAGSNDMMDFFDFSQVPKDPLILSQRTCSRLTKAEQLLLASEDPD
jgi:phospholipase C